MTSITFERQALEHLEEWSGIDLKMVKKIIELIADIRKHPFEGIGKPEPLKHEFKGCWSRRINQEHRMIYRVKSEAIEILSCKGHYKKL